MWLQNLPCSIRERTESVCRLKEYRHFPGFPADQPLPQDSFYRIPGSQEIAAPGTALFPQSRVAAEADSDGTLQGVCPFFQIIHAEPPDRISCPGACPHSPDSVSCFEFAPSRGFHRPQRPGMPLPHEL